MKKILLVLIAFIVPLSTYAGNCTNWAKVNSISNLIIEGGQVIVNGDVSYGNTYNVATQISGGMFVLPSSANSEFKKHTLSALLTAQSTSMPVYFQLNSSREIVKSAIGSNTTNLDCTQY